MTRDERTIISDDTTVEQGDLGATLPPGGVAQGPIDEERVVVGREEIATPDGRPVADREIMGVDQRRRRPVDPIAVALGTLLLILVVAGGVWWYLSSSDEQTVPNVEGLAVADAVARLEDDQLDARVTRSASDLEEGTVIDQTPSAGEEAAEGSTVVLTVSSGPAAVSVPNAVGLREVDARERLVDRGFEVESSERFSEQPPTTVVSQVPEAGAEAKPGSVVRLVVSKGSGRVDVPSVVGLSRADAEAQLSGVDLEANVVEVPSDLPPGTVVAQSPSGGSATRGDAVRLNVSAGR